ncbi:hydrogenase maturation nickel metallochaperone HypA [Ferrimonas lipolytica]|uniref:Hydrogenase maturation factor HypA n=1 Tax=Ferrimonas lipolytica TaxID=2724191 RepID=A0A6H1UAZ3_9GAMM|nr:hydrogenase maturation nickel metallochaperone HypA [Ferrimonas lipolytica]QIZ76247.1 hydrogenase maturation nickel metallochaperone HypA [Ferrimonas lipolytica]
MHELSLCLETIELIERQAAKHNFRRVKQLWIEIGALSCVEPESIRFGFETSARGTIAEGCKLHLKQTLGQATCLSCEREVTVDRRGQCCPHCQSFRLHVTGGNTMRMLELEVE